MNERALGLRGLLERRRAHDVLEAWEGLMYSRQRSASFLLQRHRALFGPEYARALSGCTDAAARGRALRLLGRDEDARRELEAASAGQPEASGWLWELDFARGLREGRADDGGLLRALEAQPKNPVWRGLRAVALYARASAAKGKPRGLRERTLEAAEEALELDPAWRAGLIVSALCLRDLGRYAEAVSRLDAALPLVPQEAALPELKAMTLARMGDRAGMIRCLEDAVYADEGTGYFQNCFLPGTAARTLREKVVAATEVLAADPEAYWMRVYRGDCRRSPEVCDYLGALADFEEAVRQKPDCAYAWSYLARARLSHGTPDAARQAADRSVELRPDCGWIWTWRGEVRRRLGDGAGSLADFDRGIRLAPSYEFGPAWRGGALRAMGRLEEASADLELACALDPGYAWAYNERALVLRSQGRIAEAMERVEQACRLDPKFGWATRPQDFPGALAELKTEVRRHPEHAKAWAWMGELLLRMRDFKGAQKALDRALALEPDDAWALAWRGRARSELGQGRPALADLDRSIRLDGRYANAHAWRGRLHHERGRRKLALRDLSRACELDAKSAWMFYWKGLAEQSLGRLDAAKASMDFSLGIEPRYREAMVCRASVLAKLGRTDGARRDIDAAMALDAGDAEALVLSGGLWERAGRLDRAARDYRAALDVKSGRLDLQARRSAAGFLAGRRKPQCGEDAALAAARERLQAGDHGAADSICTWVLKRSSRLSAAYELRSQARRNVADYRGMARDRDAVARIERGAPGAVLARGSARWMAGDCAGALRDAAKAAAHPQAGPSLRSGAAVLSSEALRGLGRFDEAAAAAEQAMRLGPGAWPLVVRAKALRQAGECDAALRDVEAALKAEPGHAKAWAWKGEILRKLGRGREAIVALEEALRLDPRCAWALALRGESKRLMGELGAGLADVLAAVAMDGHCSCDFDLLSREPRLVREDPANAWVFAWRGAVRRGAEKWTPARRDLERACRLDPDCFWARAWLGELKLSSGGPFGSLEDIDEALRLYGGYADAWIWKGRALSEQGRWTESRQAFDRALSLDSGLVWAWVGLGVCLEKLRLPGEAQTALAHARDLAPALFSSGARP